MYSAGTMLWLPPKQNIPSEYLTILNGIDEGYFGHPVLVLAVDSAHKKAAVLVITSFGGKNLLEKFPHERRKKLREQHVPIHPSDAHPDNGSCYFLADGERLSKNSYVKTTPTRIVEAKLLQSWNHGKCRLKTKCLRKLLKKINFKTPWPNIPQQHKPVTIPQSPVLHQLPPPYRIPIQPQRTEPRYDQTPMPITCASEYRVPGQWVHTTDRPVHVHTMQQRAPLLPRTYHTVQTPPYRSPDCSCSSFVFTLIFLAIMLFVAYLWYNRV